MKRWFCALLLSGLLLTVPVTAQQQQLSRAIVLLLLSLALLACWIPARQATKVDPLIALRSE